ncbi:MAG: hypothetical protein ISF22_08455 [Methanomassiliicoccus sp.]|nr:hypothetical protein [Methanomassiliicoccus sp.]
MRDAHEEAITVLAEIGLLLAMAVSVTIGPGLYPALTAVLSMAVIAVPWGLRRAKGFDLPWPITLAAAIVLLLHSWGIALYLYNDWFWWDKITHIAAAFVLSLIAALILMSIDKWFPGTCIPCRMVPVFTFMAVVCMGVFWEMLEFFFDGTMGITMQYSVNDTAIDLTIDMIGAALAALAISPQADRMEEASHRTFGITGNGPMRCGSCRPGSPGQSGRSK